MTFVCYVGRMLLRGRGGLLRRIRNVAKEEKDVAKEGDGIG